MKSQKIRTTKVIILHEPFSWPLTPFGIYELLENGAIGRELARARSRIEALKIIRQEGWVY